MHLSHSSFCWMRSMLAGAELVEECMAKNGLTGGSLPVDIMP